MVNETGRRIPRARLRRVTRRAAEALRLPAHTAVTISFVADRRIQRLNRRTRTVNRPTDVLAFPLHPPRAWRRARIDPDGVLRLGDVVISLDTARRQAARRGAPLREEVAVLFAHGLLHLAGYDHETRYGAARLAALTERLTA